MKKALPTSLRTEINRLAAEESRKTIYTRGAQLRVEYAARLAAGETVETLVREVREKTRVASGQPI